MAAKRSAVGLTCWCAGSRVDVDFATPTANATGGDGGLGDGETSSDGNGGIATVGSNLGPGFITGIAVPVTDRYLISRPSRNAQRRQHQWRGTCDWRRWGDRRDQPEFLGGNHFTFRNADGNIGSVDFLVQADAQAVGAANDFYRQ